MDDHYAMSICDKLERIANALEQIVSAGCTKRAEVAQEPEQRQQRTEIDWEGDFTRGNMLRVRSAIQRAMIYPDGFNGWCLSGYSWPLCLEDLQQITLQRLLQITGIGITGLDEMSEYFEAKYGQQPWNQITKPW